MTELKRITEIGIAVHELDQATKLFVDLFDAQPSEIVEIPEYDMRYCMCRLGKVDFEIMEPTSSSGIIAQFLAKRGQGLHHIAFAVDDIALTMNTMAARGVQFVSDRPMTKRLPAVDFAGRKFCDDLQFTFSQPNSILGILFEFIQYPLEYQTP